MIRKPMDPRRLTDGTYLDHLLETIADDAVEYLPVSDYRDDLFAEIQEDPKVIDLLTQALARVRDLLPDEDGY